MTEPDSDKAVVSGVHHIGILVANLDAAVTFATQRLGLEIDKRVSLREERTEIVFLRCGGVLIELIEISDPDVRDRRARIPGANAEIEHVALAVDDLEAAVEELSLAGVTFTAGAGKVETTSRPLEVAGTKSLFTSRRTSAGILLQLIEETNG